MVDVHKEAGPVVVIVAVILTVVLGDLVLGHHAGVLVVGFVHHAADMYLPSSPLWVAVRPDMDLVSGEHHLVSAGHDGVSYSHRT